MCPPDGFLHHSLATSAYETAGCSDEAAQSANMWAKAEDSERTASS